MKTGAKKLLVLGIDAMDPSLTRKYLQEGAMPNTQKFLERGAAAKDLVMLGGHPGITPPMWTTLATGCYANVHGITCYMREVSAAHDMQGYNFSSKVCQAEQLWNVTVEAGLKTLVFHWPGSSWPPSSDSPLLHVVDGTQPEVVNMGVAQVENEFVFQANVNNKATYFQPKAASDENIPCVTTGLNVSTPEEGPGGIEQYVMVEGAATNSIPLNDLEGVPCMSDAPYDVAQSTLKEAEGWANAPEDAKEFVLLLSSGFIRRPSLLLKNEAGVYDRVAIYRSKKDEQPMLVLNNDEYTMDILDQAYYHEEFVEVTRNMRVLSIDPAGSSVKIWVSAAMKCGVDTLFAPSHLYHDLVASIGYPPPACNIGAGSRQLIEDCMLRTWDHDIQWHANALLTLIEQEKYDVVFSHMHSIDAIGHMLLRYMKTRDNSKLSEEEYQEFFKRGYVQADDYIGKFLHLLDEGWTIMIVSDHGQLCSEYGRTYLNGVGHLAKLGYAVLKTDENGQPIKEYDLTKTRAMANRSQHIYINLKGREPEGIVDPADKYELEEQIMTDLYALRDPVTNKRIISVALRNRDAILLGMGGEYPQAGDIIYWFSEGYNGDHGDSLSTTLGYADTSVSPIFMAAGAGIKVNTLTERYIRQVDVVPTIAALLGLRMPDQCEGAPIYQIMEGRYGML